MALEEGQTEVRWPAQGIKIKGQVLVWPALGHAGHQVNNLLTGNPDHQTPARQWRQSPDPRVSRFPLHPTSLWNTHTHTHTILGVTDDAWRLLMSKHKDKAVTFMFPVHETFVVIHLNMHLFYITSLVVETYWEVTLIFTRTNTQELGGWTLLATNSLLSHFTPLLSHPSLLRPQNQSPGPLWKLGQAWGGGVFGFCNEWSEL